MRSFNGFGTKILGVIEWNDDGSYSTVKWIIFFHIPIFPLGCYKIYEENVVQERSLMGGTQLTKFVMKKIPMQWGYVLRIMGVLYISIALGALFFSLPLFLPAYWIRYIQFAGGIFSIGFGGLYVAYKLQVIGE
jgi:hypothetical protein